MVFPKARLCGGMQLVIIGKLSEALIYHRHENFTEWWGNGNAPEIVHVPLVPLPLIQWHHLCVAPAGRCQLVNGTFAEKCS
jgi:hypothetical protein